MGGVVQLLVYLWWRANRSGHYFWQGTINWRFPISTLISTISPSPCLPYLPYPDPILKMCLVLSYLFLLIIRYTFGGRGKLELAWSFQKKSI